MLTIDTAIAPTAFGEPRTEASLRLRAASTTTASATFPGDGRVKGVFRSGPNLQPFDFKEQLIPHVSLQGLVPRFG